MPCTPGELRAWPPSFPSAKGRTIFVCRLAGWVHDVADYKVSGDEEVGQDRVRSWLRAQDLEPRVVVAVMEIIGGMSFAGGGRPPMRTLPRSAYDPGTDGSDRG